LSIGCALQAQPGDGRILLSLPCRLRQIACGL
jgi:hypothetical protein